jgi:hypothetical protein
MSRDDLARIAREQNDRDHAAGLLPSRYVEDVAVLTRIAGMLLDGQGEGGGGRAPAA